MFGHRLLRGLGWPGVSLVLEVSRVDPSPTTPRWPVKVTPQGSRWRQLVVGSPQAHKLHHRVSKWGPGASRPVRAGYGSLARIGSWLPKTTFTVCTTCVDPTWRHLWVVQVASTCGCQSGNTLAHGQLSDLAYVWRSFRNSFAHTAGNVCGRTGKDGEGPQQPMLSDTSSQPGKRWRCPSIRETPLARSSFGRSSFEMYTDRNSLFPGLRAMNWKG